jgi:hypothetical protein
VQVLEIGIDALDAAAIRPFWAAVLGTWTNRGGPGRGTGSGRELLRQTRRPTATRSAAGLRMTTVSSG